MEEYILDHPETPLNGNPQRNLRDYRLNTVDHTLNMILVIITGLSALAGIVTPGGFIIALLLLFVLGVYQVLSALIGAIRGNRAKLVYLIVAITACLLAALVGYLMENFGFGEEIGMPLIILGVFCCYGGACYYTHLCNLAKKSSAI